MEKRGLDGRKPRSSCRYIKYQPAVSLLGRFIVVIVRRNNSLAQTLLDNALI
jgi:hypothetical protein